MSQEVENRGSLISVPLALREHYAGRQAVWGLSGPVGGLVDWRLTSSMRALKITPLSFIYLEQKEFDHSLFLFWSLFGRFFDASVTFFVAFCQTPFAKLLLQQGEKGMSAERFIFQSLAVH